VVVGSKNVSNFNFQLRPKPETVDPHKGAQRLHARSMFGQTNKQIASLLHGAEYAID
jgi:hypothetical protein